MNITDRLNDPVVLSILNLASVGLMLVDDELNPIYSNNSAVHLTLRKTLDKPPTDTNPFMQRFRPDGTIRPVHELASVRALAEKTAVHKIVTGFKHTDSDKITWVETSASPLFDAQNEITAVWVAILDVTDRVEAQQERAELEAEKNQIVQNIAHEQRTKMAIIAGHVSLIMEGELGPLTEDQASSIKVIHKAVYDLLDFTNQQLVIVGANEGQGQSFRQTNISNIMANVCQAMRPLALKKQIRFECNVFPNLHVFGDNIMLEQSLIDLVDNAIKFTDQGKVTINLSRLEDLVAITVEDTGIGVSANEQQKIFRKFYQIDGRANRRYEGTGIGLAVVQSVVKAHNGRVEVESELGAGSKFSLYLPERK